MAVSWVFSNIDIDNKGLREYQIETKVEIYKLWETSNNVMLQMPTGTGKTIVFTSIVKDVSRLCESHKLNSRILIIAHRKELIQQASDKLTKRGILHGIIQGSTPQNLDRRVQVASIQTFMAYRTFEKVKDLPFDFIIIDEAHHSMAASYQKLWNYYPDSKKLGVTATPWRMSHSGFTTLFEHLVISHSIEWFVNNGYLSNYDYISIGKKSDVQKVINSIDKFGADGDYLEDMLATLFDRDEIRAKLYANYKKFAYGKKGIIYAINREHARHILETYSSYGIAARLIDGKTPAEERDSVINAFKKGEIEIIINVNIFSEGFDCPDIDFVQLARPTRSLAMYLQQVGRALRISEGKSKALILDNVGLYNRFGTPMARRQWKRHFKGKEDATETGFNDGTSRNGSGFEIVYEEPSYEEGDEEMSVVEHAEGKRQIRSEEANDTDRHLSDFNIIKRDGFYGVCNRYKRIIIPPIYEDMHPYYKGLIPFKQNGRWGIMYGNGRVVVQPKYYLIGAFKDGLSEVQNKEDSKPYHINERMRRVD